MVERRLKISNEKIVRNILHNWWQHSTLEKNLIRTYDFQAKQNI